MISSDEGLRILKNWQTEKTLLWFVALAFSDLVPTVDVRVKTLTFDPPEVVLAERSGETLPPLDLAGAELREADPAKEPPLLRASPPSCLCDSCS